ncbi:GAF domain-containing protein [Allocatelliglobosispora scoriae]|uniref:GAF domain-containing protein n=1 Tax=Allocatelliglobosispora scoriae TaxID=643052 RepID=A0A841BJT8_9ACTN|nr:SpoIIE family protein phosphatase [Allocatelliglobosispora scoriae]MBB5867905.1 GAF domain-containing protein [Allocatelliglobosispora scoriae]
MIGAPEDSSRTEGLWWPGSVLRLITGLILAFALPAGATLLADARALGTFPSLLYVLCVVIAALVGRLAAGTVAVAVSALMLDLFVITPIGSLSQISKDNAADLGLFVVLSWVIAALMARTEQTRAVSKRAHQTTETAHRRLGLIADTSRMLAASFDLPTNLHAVCAAIVDHGTFTHAAVLTTQADGIEILAGAQRRAAKPQRWWRSTPSTATPAARIDTGAGFESVPAALRNRSIRILDPATRRGKTRFGPWPYRSGLVVPLLIGNDIIGALVLLDTAERRTYSHHDVVFAREMGERVARAIDTARSYQHQAHIARTLQQSLLPQTLPPIPGVTVHARYQAGAGTEVGGDFYDLFPIGDDTWLVVVGDVCGKGPEAAVVMSLTRATLRALALHEHSPKRLLTLLNEALLAQLHDYRFVTVSLATLRPQGGRLVVDLALAGHPPPIVRRAGTATAATDSYGTLLGGFPNIRLGETSLVLAPGESIVFYTDGVEDHQTSAKDQATRLLEQLGDAPADRIADVFTASARNAPPGKQDDLVVLTLELDR